MADKRCTCPIRPKMTKQELLDEVYRAGKNCGEPYFICPTLDKEMRRAEKDEAFKRYQKKSLKAKGLTDEEIANRPRRRRRTHPATFKSVEL